MGQVHMNMVYVLYSGNSCELSLFRRLDAFGNNVDNVVRLSEAGAANGSAVTAPVINCDLTD
jgi:hypothetical protein